MLACGSSISSTLAAELLDLRERGVHGVAHAGLEPRLLHPPHAEAQAVEALGARQREAAGMPSESGVARVAALEVAQQDRGVGHVARSGPHWSSDEAKAIIP